jgi:uncharacterized membrane protein YkoI
MNHRLRSLLLALPLVLAVAMPAAAGGHGHGQGQEQKPAMSSGGISAEQAAAIVRRAYDGRVVSVKPEGDVYKVRVLLDGGRVKTVQVDSHGNVSDSN